MDDTGSGLFAGPVAVMLAKTSAELPGPSAVAGGAAWEWKYDGYRLVIQVPPAGPVRLWSRRGTELSATFPDLAVAAAEQLPPGVVVDGEAVIWADGTLSFDQLQHRMASRPAAVAKLVGEWPASFVAFDLLGVAGTDIRALPWRDRRALLDELASGFAPPLQLSPYTDDHTTAQRWMAELPPGIEGLVTKGQASPYRAGQRGWLKTKRYETQDVIVGAVIGSVERPEAVVVGRYTPGGQLRIIGRSTALTNHQAAQLASAVIAVGVDEHPWPAEIHAGQFGGGAIALAHVAPTLVVEIAGDTARQTGRYRHSVRLVRLRPDLAPADIGTAGIDAGGTLT